MLPSIRDMYNCTRENHDYNTIKAYEGPHKNFAINSKPTKKDHYLDQAIKLNSSPGPASNSLTMQITQTSKQLGSRKIRSKAKEQKSKHTSMKYAKDRRRITALPLIIIQYRWAGRRKKTCWKTFLKRPISLIHVSTIVTKFQDQGLIMPAASSVLSK